MDGAGLGAGGGCGGLSSSAQRRPSENSTTYPSITNHRRSASKLASSVEGVEGTGGAVGAAPGEPVVGSLEGGEPEDGSNLSSNCFRLIPSFERRNATSFCTCSVKPDSDSNRFSLIVLM